MDSITRYIDLQDLVALAFFLVCWIGYAQFTAHKSQRTKSLLAVTNRYRRQWMQEMIRRDAARTMDAIMIGNLQRSITFFANTSIFLVLGLITMLGYHDRSTAILASIPFAKESSPFLWEIKIFTLIIIFIYSFFKYSWSLRQYNYAGIFVNSVPPAKDCIAEHDTIVSKGSYLVSNAAKHFNMGLRAYYFGLAALAWFIHPFLFILATAWVVFVTHRREYHSSTLENLSQ